MTSFTAQLGPIASALGLQLKLILPLSTLPTTSQALYCSRQPPPTTVETTEGDVALTVATTTIVVTTIVVIVLAPSVGIPTRILFFGTCNHYGIGHLPSQCPNHDLSTIRNRPISNFVDSSASIPSTSTTWYPDTGANSHVTPDLARMDDNRAYHVHDNLNVSDGKGLPNLHIGSSRFHSPNKTLHLSKILHVPNITKHLLSVQQFCITIMSSLNFTLLVCF